MNTEADLSFLKKCVLQRQLISMHQLTVKFIKEIQKGYTVSGKDNEKLVYKLNKSLYGLKQSGRNRNSVLNNELVDNWIQVKFR